jgi:hypothetical protein
MKYIRHAIAAMGQGLGPAVLDQCRALFDAEQVALAQAVPVAARDLAYGPHEGTGLISMPRRRAV